MRFGGVCDGVGDDVDDVMVGEVVSVLFADALGGDQPSGAQYLEVLRHGRLCDPEGVDEFVDAAVLFGEFVHDLQPPRMGQGLQQRRSLTVRLG